MLRKGIVALMITVMSAGLSADDKKTGSLMGFLRGPVIGRPQQDKQKSGSGIRHAVVTDAALEAPEVRQVSLKPAGDQLRPSDESPQPTPAPAAAATRAPAPRAIEQAPPVPNTSPISGPQYFSAASAQGPSLPVRPAANWQTYSAPVTTQAAHPYHMISSHNILPAAPHAGYGAGIGAGNHHLPMVVNNVPMGGNAGALYPAPKPGIPPEVGGTSIVHHALHPHEMLYPHRYKAMYGPYYYKVNGKWMVTPFGVWSKENWKLQGTRVDVKYKSHISPFAKFHPPVIR